MTAMPMCAEQYAVGAGSGRRSPTWNSLRKAPEARSEKNIRPVLWVPPAGFHGRGCHVVIGGQPAPKDSSTQFTTVPSLLNMTEWNKSTAPRCPRCRRNWSCHRRPSSGGRYRGPRSCRPSRPGPVRRRRLRPCGARRGRRCLGRPPQRARAPRGAQPSLGPVVDLVRIAGVADLRLDGHLRGLRRIAQRDLDDLDDAVQRARRASRVAVVRVRRVQVRRAAAGVDRDGAARRSGPQRVRRHVHEKLTGGTIT